MRPFVVRPLSHLKGEIFLSGDKSIAHRSIIVSALAQGLTRIKNFPAGKDCLSTVKAFRKLGIKIRQESRRKGSGVITVFGKGLRGLKRPKGPVLVGDSGTTLRLLLGVLAGQNFRTKLVAGPSLSQRPMLRVTKPLRMMGSKIKARVKKQGSKIEEYPPITIRGGNLKPIAYKMPLASAQVKSAIILAALYAKGKTYVRERVRTRDHTERMLKLFRADIKVNPSTTLRVDGERSRTINRNTIVIKGNKALASPATLTIPGDISSAAFFIILAAMIPDSKVLIRKVSLNPSRTGIIRVLKRMGANIKVTSYQLPVTSCEPSGDLLVTSSKLNGITVRKEEIPSLIDELPILMVAASNARGRTIFEGVGELRVKETDRINSMAENLMEMGASIQIKRAQERENIIIEGVKQLKGTGVRSFGDHRTAMSMVVAGLAAAGKSRIDDISCINKSFPDFLSLLNTLKD